MNDTIAAVATASGEGGIGIVRISGSGAVAVADRIFQTRSRTPVVELAARQATLGDVVYADAVIDEALLLKFVSPNSYTGEDVVEIQAHGGAIAVKNILLAALGNGARLADPAAEQKIERDDPQQEGQKVQEVQAVIIRQSQQARQGCAAGQVGGAVIFKHAVIIGIDGFLAG